MINNNIHNMNYLKYEKAVDMVMEEVDNVLSASPYIISQYTKHLTKTRGKFIRAYSLLTCALNDEGLIHPNAVKFAAAIEILHLATLVHDDVIDDSDLRRGSITLQKKFGKKTAVICGDYLLSMALSTGASIPNKKDYLDLDLPDYVSRLCFGELKQHINNGNFGLSTIQYLKIISGKTAALFEASFYAGAILSTKDKYELNKYKLVGKYIGMIFQLTDDCMDFEATKTVAKKPVQSDFEQKVITLPMIHAFNKIKDLKLYSNILTKDKLINAVKKSGGIEYTKSVAKKYYDKSLSIINDLNVDSDKKAGLMTILDKAYRTK